MKTVGIGLLGFGTVGAGVVMGLNKNQGLLENRTGLKLELRRIADIDIERDRGVSVPPGVLTRDTEAVVASPEIDIVIELIGGLNAARKLITQALQRGKPVVTANKALLAEHGAELFKLAEANRTDIFFEASVGGGIPLIRSLRVGLVSNHIRSIYGILNGTCNYILTRMEQNRMSFATALKEAQKAGFAEADPALDVDGIDTAHKAVILASLAYGFNVPMREVAVEGIRGLNALDLRYALELGYRIKMLAVIEQENGDVTVRVCPTLVPMEHIIASVNGVFNAVLIEGDEVGDVLCYGKGAGRDPTASAILGDVVDAARNLVCHAARRSEGGWGDRCPVLSAPDPLGQARCVRPDCGGLGAPWHQHCLDPAEGKYSGPAGSGHHHYASWQGKSIPGSPGRIGYSAGGGRQNRPVPD